MEQEFSFKDLFIYCIKKWFVIALLAVIGASVFLFIEIGGIDRKTEIFSAELKFMTHEQFKMANAQSDDASIASYNNLFNQTIAYVTSNKNEKEFLTQANDPTTALNTSFKTLYYSDKQLTKMKGEPNFAKNFYSDVTTTTNAAGNYLIVSIKADAKTDAKQNAAKFIIDSFLKMGEQYARDNISVLNSYESNPLIGKTLSAEAATQNVTEPATQNWFTKILLGLIIGVVAGFAVMIVVYFADGRIKSFSQLGDNCGSLLAKTDSDEIEISAVRRVVATSKDKKFLLITSAGRDGLVSEFASLAVSECVYAGMKTLFIDFNKADANEPGFKHYAETGDLSFVKKTDKGYDELGCAQEGDWMPALSHLNNILALGNTYDKIVMAACDLSDGAAAALASTDSGIVYIINQREVKYRNFVSMLSDINNPGGAIGTFIHNSI